MMCMSDGLAARELDAPFPGATYLVAWLKSVLRSASLRTEYSVEEAQSGAAGSGRLPRRLLVHRREGRLRLPDHRCVPGVQSKTCAPQRIAVVRHAHHVRLGCGSYGSWSHLPEFSPVDYLVTRRFGLTPGLLTHYYVQYAGEYGHTWYSQSWLKLVQFGRRAVSVGYRVGDWLDPGTGTKRKCTLVG